MHCCRSCSERKNDPRAPVTLVAHDIGPAAQLVFGHHLAKHHGDHCGIQWRPLVTSTFLGQHNSYAGKSIRPLHTMVTSTMSNRLGEGCILMVLRQENLKTCCKFYVFTLVDVQGEGVRLDFVATDQVSTRCRHTEWNARPPECDPGI